MVRMKLRVLVPRGPQSFTSDRGTPSRSKRYHLVERCWPYLWQSILRRQRAVLWHFIWAGVALLKSCPENLDCQSILRTSAVARTWQTAFLTYRRG